MPIIGDDADRPSGATPTGPAANDRLRPRTVDGAPQLLASWRAGVLVQRGLLLPLSAFLLLLVVLNVTSGESTADMIGNTVLLVPPAVVLAWIGWTSSAATARGWRWTRSAGGTPTSWAASS